MPPYAAPDYRLPIKSVRQRLYRGPCRKIEELVPTLELFNAKKDSVYAVFAAIKDLDPKRLKEVNDYLADFYKTIEKPKKFDGEMGYACSQQR